MSSSKGGFKPGYAGPKTRLRYKPSQWLIKILNEPGVTMPSEDYRNVAARDRKERKAATELEAHRAEMKRKIELYGPDYRNWPESGSKGKSVEVSEEVSDAIRAHLAIASNK